LLPRVLLWLGVALPCAVQVASAQVLGAGLRAGAGWDGRGETVYVGQLELVEFGRWSSVEVGVSAFEGGVAEDYRRTPEQRTYDYHEETHVRGVALTAGILLWHPPKDSRGPYVVLGLGVGPIDVDWRTESPTDGALGSPLGSGGSYATDNGILAGSLGNAGLGMRLHAHVDVRAQGLMLVVPSTDTREDMKIVRTLTLTAGLTF
jgi:hypothetical protein